MAMLCTHNAEQEWEQQQMHHGCHDHSLGRIRKRRRRWRRYGREELEKMVKEVEKAER